VGELGRPKIEDLRATVSCDEDGLGLQIAVDNALFMRRCQPMGDGNRVFDRPAPADLVVAEMLPQGLALEER
jgi:hypothetical protein